MSGRRLRSGRGSEEDGATARQASGRLRREGSRGSELDLEVRTGFSTEPGRTSQARRQPEPRLGEVQRTGSGGFTDGPSGMGQRGTRLEADGAWEGGAGLHSWGPGEPWRCLSRAGSGSAAGNKTRGREAGCGRPGERGKGRSPGRGREGGGAAQEQGVWSSPMGWSAKPEGSSGLGEGDSPPSKHVGQ